MEKIVRTVSTSFLEKLSSEKAYYQAKDFVEAGFPAFLTERITAEIQRRMAGSAEPVLSDWIDLDEEDTSEAWHQFLKSVQNKLKLPVHAAGEVVTRAVENCLRLAVRPRKTVPELLFQGKSEIHISELKKRSAAISVNGHLAYALVRYMERKQSETLQFEKAKTVVAKIDQKLISDFNPLNWLELLKPVYVLTGPSVDSDLLRIFFEDKEKNRAAKKFDMLDKSVSETDFIEVMSSADLLEIEGYDDNQPQLFDEQVDEEEDTNYEMDDEPELIDSQDEEEESAVSTEADDLNELFKATPEDDYLEQAEEDEALGFIADEDSAEEKFLEDVEDDDDDDESPNRLIEIDETSEEDEETAEPETAPFDLDEDAEETEQEKTAPAEEPQLESEESETVVTPKKDDKTELADADDPFDTDDSEDEQIPESEEKNAEEPEDDEQENEEVPLLNRFMFDDSDDEDEESRSAETIYSELNLVREDREEVTLRDLFDQVPEEEEEPENEETAFVAEDTDDQDEDTDSDYWAKNIPEEEDEEEPQEEFSGTFIADEEEDEEADESDDVPMWKSFLEREDTDEEPAFRFDDQEISDDEEEADKEEVLDEDGFIEEPIFDLTRDETEEQISRIANWLQDEENKFINEIFGNSETAYEQALAEIENFEDWKKASKFIEREVFSRNRIDVYDEIAVDFTDRLHTYFLEFKS